VWNKQCRCQSIAKARARSTQGQQLCDYATRGPGWLSANVGNALPASCMMWVRIGWKVFQSAKG
jgi:hypothetical protein